MEKFLRNNSFYAATKSVYSELELGTKYRAKKKLEDLARNCDPTLRKRTEEDDENPCAKMDELFAELNAYGKKNYADPFSVILKEAKRAQKREAAKSKRRNEKEKIVDRNLLTYRQHIRLLATPRQEQAPEKKTCKKRKKKRRTEEREAFLSPRMKQLAMPKKRLVFDNWHTYRDVLDAETVERMEEILQAGTGRNLDAAEAAKYFKGKEKKLKKPKVCNLLRNKQIAEKKWLTNQINLLADCIVEKIAQKPLPAENYRHMQLTNCLVSTLSYKGYKIKPINRNTRNFRKRVELEILDHVSVWSDRVFVRAELLERKLSVKRYEALLARSKAMEASEAERERKRRDRPRRKTPKSVLDVLDELTYAKDHDLIGSLLYTLERGRVKDLDAMIPDDLLKEVTYRRLVDKLRRLRDACDDETLKRLPGQSLKQGLVRWMKKKRPLKLSDEVNEVVDAIKECLLKKFAGTRSKRSDLNIVVGTSEHVLRSTSKDLDMTGIPLYRDANEDLEQEEPQKLPDSEDEDYGPFMYAGGNVNVVHNASLYDMENEGEE